MNSPTLTIEEIKSNLGYYDPENPNNYLGGFDDEDSITPRESDCACDNCFYGRDKLALYILSTARIGSSFSPQRTTQLLSDEHLRRHAAGNRNAILR